MLRWMHIFVDIWSHDSKLNWPIRFKLCMWWHDLQPIIFQCSTSSHDSFSLSTSNYRALASHIHHITPSDAHRLLQVASHSGHAPSVGGAFSGHTSSVGGARRRPLQLRSSPTIIFNAIMGSHTSYEVMLNRKVHLLWGNDNFSNLSMPIYIHTCFFVYYFSNLKNI